MPEGVYQNELGTDELPSLNNMQLETIFKLYKTENNQYFYNITKSINIDFSNINPGVFYTRQVSQKMPWTAISYDEYKTTYLWWLICIINGIDNPLEFAETGTQLKILKPEFVNVVLKEIDLKLRSSK